MASILTPSGKNLARGTKSTPAGTSEKKFVEMNVMSLRSGKRKLTVSEDNVITPQKENIVKRRKSNKVDILNDNAHNKSVTALTPKLRDITKAVQNESPKDFTPRKINDKFSTPSQQLSVKKKNSTSIKKSFHLENDSILLLSPTPKVLAPTATNTPRKDIAKKALEMRKTNENLSSASRRSTKSNTGAIKKGSDLQNDSVIAITPKPEGLPNSAKNKSLRGKRKNAVHPAEFTEIDKGYTNSTTPGKVEDDSANSENKSVIIISPDANESHNYKQNICNIKTEESEMEVKQFLRADTIIRSSSKMAPGCSRNYMNASSDSFVLQPLPDDPSELVETSSDSEITMNLNSTYEIDESVTQNLKANLLSTRKSVHFKNSPEILGPIRRSNSFPNISIDSGSDSLPKSVKQRISTPAVRRRAGSTPVPSRKQGSSATKLPDFSLIHKRNFEKMESIYDFHHRRKGSSQKKAPPPVQESKLPRGNNVVVFKAKASSTPLPATSKIPVVPKQRNTPLKPTYSDAKEAIMRKTPVKKTPTQSTSVETNRNILKGVRLNRRFELQMKHRNMK